MEREESMTPSDLRAWQAHMGLTYDTAEPAEDGHARHALAGRDSVPHAGRAPGRGWVAWRF